MFASVHFSSVLLRYYTGTGHVQLLFRAGLPEFLESNKTKRALYGSYVVRRIIVMRVRYCLRCARARCNHSAYYYYYYHYIINVHDNILYFTYLLSIITLRKLQRRLTVEKIAISTHIDIV